MKINCKITVRPFDYVGDSLNYEKLIEVEDNASLEPRSAIEHRGSTFEIASSKKLATKDSAAEVKFRSWKAEDEDQFELMMNKLKLNGWQRV